MRILFVLLAVCGLVSCVHTSLAPLSDPQGRMMVIEIPGARVGKGDANAKPLEKANMQLAETFDGRAWPLKYFSDFSLSDDGAEVMVLSPMADLETKRGRKFVGALPFIALRSNRSADETDQALRAMVADVYKSARRHDLRMVTVDDLKDPPAESKP